MAKKTAASVHLSPEARAELEALLRRGSCTLSEQLRARIWLLADEGKSPHQVAEELGVAPNTALLWCKRCSSEEIVQDVEGALADAPRSGRPRTVRATTQMQVIATACDPLPDADGLSGWTLDLLVEELNIREIGPISRSTVHRILVENEVRPHRHKGWMHSPDPDFVQKANAIAELYHNPPPNSVVLSYDEKTGMQAIERKHPDRPASPGRLARQEFEYIRRGTQSLLATIDVHTGEVLADCGPTRTGDDMERHFERIALRYPCIDVHIVLDNLNIHKGKRWEDFNERHGGRFHFHYTPLHASWVNQIELFFSVLSRRSLRRRSFRSTQELAAHVLAFIERWNRRDKKPFCWKFRGFDTQPVEAAA